MIYPKWKGKEIVPTKKGYRELSAIGYILWEILTILEEGYDCSRSRREKGTIEKCAWRDNKIVRVVLKEQESVNPEGCIETVWKLVHVGKESFKEDRYKEWLGY